MCDEVDTSEKANKKDDKEKKKKLEMNNYKQIYGMCTGTEKCYMWTGMFFSVITGFTAPLWIYFFGDIID